MFSINTPRLNIQSCQNCKNKYVEYIGTQAWCQNCHKAVNTIEQQVKVVPRLYQSNNKQKVNSAQIKIKSYINQFCNKFGGIADNQQLQYLYGKAIQIKNMKGVNTKNYRQNSAVVVYIHYKEIHKMSIKQYCKNNQLELKSFNKNYLIYQKIMKSTHSYEPKISNQPHFNGFKKEEAFQYFKKQQELFIQNGSNQLPNSSESFLHLKRESQNEFLDDHATQIRFCELNKCLYPDTSFQYAEYGSQQQNATMQIMIRKAQIIKKQVINFLQAVFNQLFSSLLYSEKKVFLIKQLSERTIQMYKTMNLWKQTPLIQNTSVLDKIDDSNFYKYLFFIVLKGISFNITQAKYRLKIQTSTGEIIKSSVLKQIVQFYMNNEENLSVNGESMFFVQNSRTTGSQYVKIEQKQ